MIFASVPKVNTYTGPAFGYLSRGLILPPALAPNMDHIRLSSGLSRADLGPGGVCIRVDSKKLEHGFRVIFAVLGSEDGCIPLERS